MSDGAVRAAIEQMESWMADPSWEPDPEKIKQWNTAFLAALAKAEKGPDWSALMNRAHEVGRQLEIRSNQLAGRCEEARAELSVQERGTRALKGYGASAR